MTAPSAAAEWRKNWPMVVAAMAGFSLSTLGVHSMGLFIAPLGAEFGWSRATITSSLTIFAFLAAPLAPISGALVDRLGSRRLAIPGTALFAITFAAFSAMNGSVTVWWGLWCLLGLCSMAVHTSVWTTAIAQRFVAARGLALALTLSGTSLTQIMAPSLAAYAIPALGWRGAYLALGLCWGAVALALIVPFFHDARSERPRASPAPPMLFGGLTRWEALRSVRIWRIAVAELLISTINVSLIVHMVPILSWRGFGTAGAAQIAGSVGISAIVGKLLTGALLDRKQSDWLPAISLWLPALACSLLIRISAPDGAFAYLAAAIFGYSVGAYFQIVTYLTSRYAGLANFGQIFGILAALMAVGTGIGPVCAGMIYDLTGGYADWLKICIGLSIVAGFMVLRMGPYPDWKAAERA